MVKYQHCLERADVTVLRTDVTIFRTDVTVLRTDVTVLHTDVTLLGFKLGVSNVGSPACDNNV